MNYLAHGFRFLHEPYFVAGTSLPDWLNVADRRTRCRRRHASKFVTDPDPRVAAFARGVVQHHQDDDWFHLTDAFAELSLRFAMDLRDHCPRQNSVRTGFVGHILVELLIDAALIRRRPQILDGFYDAVGQVEPSLIATAVNAMTGREVPQLTELIPRFVEVRFLADYTTDARLLYRINQVLQRVRLTNLSESVLPLFAAARTAVDDRLGEWFEEFSPSGI